MSINVINFFNTTQISEVYNEQNNNGTDSSFVNLLELISNELIPTSELNIELEENDAENTLKYDSDCLNILVNNINTIKNSDVEITDDSKIEDIELKDNSLESLETNNTKIAKSGMEIVDDVKYKLEKEYKLNGEYMNDVDSITSDNGFIEEIENTSKDITIKIKDNSIFNQTDSTENRNQEEFLDGDINDLNILEKQEASLEDEIANLVNDKSEASNILNQLKEGLQSTSTPKHIKIILKPRTLGTLNVNIKFINQSMHVDIYVDSDDIKNILLKNLSEVEYLLNPDNSLNIENINIIRKQDEAIKENFDYKKQLFKKMAQEYRVPKTRPIMFM